jgi:sulfide:quinone oxidoreductase
VLIHRIRGGATPAPYPGQITCYIEMGDETIGKVDVDFLSGPAPVAAFTPPTLDGADEKRAFGAARRARWFGRNSEA